MIRKLTMVSVGLAVQYATVLCLGIAMEGATVFVRDGFVLMSAMT